MKRPANSAEKIRVIVNDRGWQHRILELSLPLPITMRAVRLLCPLREVAVLLSQRVVFFSACSAANTKSTNYFSSDGEKGSSLLQYPRKFIWNSADFVGTVEQPLTVQNGRDHRFGAWTFLRVKATPESDSTFRILLKLWGEMAESSVNLFKPNDFIYVAGTLEAYKKPDYAKSNLYYKLTVRELNYISRYDQGSRSQNYGDMGHEEGEARWENYRKRLHLWQVFFSSPDEWWDNRKLKSNSKQPDFRHKDTGEALWLSSTDPPWIRKQLELIDAKMAERGRNATSDPDRSISNWLFC